MFRIGRPELSEMAEFKNNEDRVSHRDTLIPLLTAALATKSNSEWSRLFEGAAFPYGPVNTMEEVFEDPQVQVEGGQAGDSPSAGPAPWAPAGGGPLLAGQVPLSA